MSERSDGQSMDTACPGPHDSQTSNDGTQEVEERTSRGRTRKKVERFSPEPAMKNKRAKGPDKVKSREASEQSPIVLGNSEAATFAVPHLPGSVPVSELLASSYSRSPSHTSTQSVDSENGREETREERRRRQNREAGQRRREKKKLEKNIPITSDVASSADVLSTHTSQVGGLSPSQSIDSWSDASSSHPGSSINFHASDTGKDETSKERRRRQNKESAQRRRDKLKDQESVKKIREQTRQRVQHFRYKKKEDSLATPPAGPRKTKLPGPQTPSSILSNRVADLMINGHRSTDEDGPQKRLRRSDGPGPPRPIKQPRMYRAASESLHEFEERKARRLRGLTDNDLPVADDSHASSSHDYDDPGHDGGDEDEETKERDRAIWSANHSSLVTNSNKKEWGTLNKRRSVIILPTVRNSEDIDQRIPDQFGLKDIKTCKHCAAITYNTTNCCGGGSVQIPPPVEQHPYFRELITGDDAKGKHIRENLVKYNASFSMGAISYERDKTIKRGHPFIRVNGGMHCKIGGTSIPKGKTVPLYHQLYKYDSNDATEFRKQNPVIGSALKPNILRNLHAILEENNHLVQQYKNAMEIFTEQAKNNEPIRNVFMILRNPEEVNYSGQTHRGCYSLPKAQMQSAIYTTEPDGGPGKMKIFIKHRQFGGKVETIGFYNPLVDPLEYPLIFMYGNPGFMRVYKLWVNYLNGADHDPGPQDNSRPNGDVLDEIEREMPLQLDQKNAETYADLNPFPFEGLGDEMDKGSGYIDYSMARKKWKAEERAKGIDVSSSEDESSSSDDNELPGPLSVEDSAIMEEYISDEESKAKPHYIFQHTSDEDEEEPDPNRIVKVSRAEDVAARKEQWLQREKEMEEFAIEQDRREALRIDKIRIFKDMLLVERFNSGLFERLFKDEKEIKNVKLDLDLLQRRRYQYQSKILYFAEIFVSKYTLDRTELHSYEDFLKLEVLVNTEMEKVLCDPGYRRDEPKIKRFLVFYISLPLQDDNEDLERDNIDPVQQEVGEAHVNKRNKAVTKSCGKHEYVSRRQYVLHQMQMRERTYHPILSTLTLAQLYIVDQVLRIIRQRQDNSRDNLIKLRGSHEGTLTYLIHSQSAARKGFNLGYAFQLGPNDQQSVAWYKEQFENAMTTMDACGKPDLFITMTGDPTWEEIEKNKLPHSNWQSNPFLVNDVFYLKQQELLNDIIEKELFGPVVAYCYSIEFQKRGMPHMHLLVTLKRGHKLDTSDKIDKVVKAVIPPLPADDDPDRVRKTRFHNNVINHMLHTACIDNPDSYCNLRSERQKNRVHTRCTKNFPVPFTTHTSTIDGGKVNYYRPDDGMFVMRRVNGKMVKVDNRFVVPYNEFLLNKYSCHINVEAITETNVVKYIYKYVYKGVDRALVQFIETFEVDDGNYGQPCRTSVHTMKNEGVGVLIPRGVKPEKKQLKMMRERIMGELRKQNVQVKPGERLTAYDEAILVESFRQMTPSEAAWILQAYPLSCLSHTVITLRVHEEGHMPIHWREGELQKAMQNVAEGKVKSQFVAWFELNKKERRERPTEMDPEEKAKMIADTLTYDQIPLFYVFEKNAWRPYKNTRSRNIVRMQPVSPRFLEKFAIRLLAMNQRGCTSFADLFTVRGVTYGSAHEAAKQLGLMNSQIEFHCCLSEAVGYEYPNRLRALFATMIIFGGVEDPRQLWDDFEKEFFDRKWGADVDRAREAALAHLEYLLTEHGHTLRSFRLPGRNSAISLTEDDINFAIDGNETRRPVTDNDAEASEMERSLNEDQRKAYNTILRAVENSGNGREGNCFFLQGSGGCGKTYVYRALKHRLEAQGVPVAMIATTGIAATLLIDGQTAHRAFSLPMNAKAGCRSNMQVRTYPADQLDLFTVFIIDEATMANRFMYEAIHELLGDITGQKDRPFGGKIMLLGGDWKQLLPVVQGGTSADSSNYSLKRDPLWGHFKVLTLTKNMRAAKDPVYSKLLENVGNGLVNGSPDLNVRLPHECIAQTEEDVINFIYADLKSAPPSEIVKSCILATLNEEVDELNEKVLDMLPGPLKTYISIDKPKPGAGMQCRPEDYWKETPSGMPPHELRLKVNAIIILLRNICVSKGLCNGSRLRVVQMGEHNIICELLTTKFAGSIVWLSKSDIDPSSKSAKNNTNFTRFQIPVRLAYAMTINKSQGQTFDRVGVILKNNVFSHGQLYVALSRARESSKVRLFSASRAFFGEKPFVMIRNTVDRSILEEVDLESVVDPNYVDPGLLPALELPEEKIDRRGLKKFIHDNSRPQSSKVLELLNANAL